jgi:hypothetical protein
MVLECLEGFTFGKLYAHDTDALQRALWSDLTKQNPEK